MIVVTVAVTLKISLKFSNAILKACADIDVYFLFKSDTYTGNIVIQHHNRYGTLVTGYSTFKVIISLKDTSVYTKFFLTWLTIAAIYRNLKVEAQKENKRKIEN